MAKFRPRETAEFVADYLMRNKAVAPGITRTRLITLIMEAFLQKGQTKSVAKQLIREAKEGRKPGETMIFHEKLKDWKPKVGQDPQTNSLKMFNKEGDKLKPLNLKGITTPGTKGSKQAQRQQQMMEVLNATPGSTGLKRQYTDLASYIRAVFDMEQDVTEFLEMVWGQDYDQFTLVSDYKRDQKAVAVEKGLLKVEEWFNEAQKWLTEFNRSDVRGVRNYAWAETHVVLKAIELFKNLLDDLAGRGSKVREDLSKSARVFSNENDIRQAHEQGANILNTLIGKIYRLKEVLKDEQTKWEESIKDKGAKA